MPAKRAREELKLIYNFDIREDDSQPVKICLGFKLPSFDQYPILQIFDYEPFIKFEGFVKWFY